MENFDKENTTAAAKEPIDDVDSYFDDEYTPSDEELEYVDPAMDLDLESLTAVKTIKLKQRDAADINESSTSKESLVPTIWNSAELKIIDNLDCPDFIKQLIKLGFTILPVAPRQPDIFLDKDKTILKFTGKCPSYLELNYDCSAFNKDGIKVKNYNPKLIKHEKLTLGKLANYIAGDINNYCIICGHLDIHCIDIDRKHFKFDEEIKQAYEKLVAKLGDYITWTESTPSGGYHIYVKLKKPEFTNFKLDDYDFHCGELLGSGRIAVIAPSRLTNGSYDILIDNFSKFDEIVSIEDITKFGILPANNTASNEGTSYSLSELEKFNQYDPNARYSLRYLISNETKQLINNAESSTDRSNDFTKILREIIGWCNLFIKHNYKHSDNLIELISKVIKKFNLEDKAERIIKSVVDLDSCLPAKCLHKSEEEILKELFNDNNMPLFENKESNLVEQTDTNKQSNLITNSDKKHNRRKYIQKLNEFILEYESIPDKLEQIVAKDEFIAELEETFGQGKKLDKNIIKKHWDEAHRKLFECEDDGRARQYYSLEEMKNAAPKDTSNEICGQFAVKGKTTVFAGKEKLGKSKTATSAVSARSKRTLFLGLIVVLPGNTAYYFLDEGQDDNGKKWVELNVSANQNSNVTCFNVLRKEDFNLNSQFTKDMKNFNIDWLVLDSLTAYFSFNLIDSSNPQIVYTEMKRIVKWAEVTGIAVTILDHCVKGNKDTRGTRSQISGFTEKLRPVHAIFMLDQNKDGLKFFQDGGRDHSGFSAYLRFVEPERVAEVGSYIEVTAAKNSDSENSKDTKPLTLKEQIKNLCKKAHNQKNYSFFNKTYFQKALNLKEEDLPTIKTTMAKLVSQKDPEIEQRPKTKLTDESFIRFKCEEMTDEEKHFQARMEEESKYDPIADCTPEEIDILLNDSQEYATNEDLEVD